MCCVVHTCVDGIDYVGYNTAAATAKLVGSRNKTTVSMESPYHTGGYARKFAVSVVWCTTPRMNSRLQLERAHLCSEIQ